MTVTGIATPPYAVREKNIAILYASGTKRKPL